MKLEQLRYFVEAARFQHVGRAGKALHISASAVSSAVSSLEEELGVTLFDRIGNRVVLSETGRRLVERVERVFDSVEGIRTDFSQGRSAEFQGELRMSGSHFLSAHFLNRCWIDFHRRHPKLVGEVRSAGTAEVIKSLLAGHVDVGLCFSPLKHPELVVREIHRGRLVPVVRKGHPLLGSGLRRLLPSLSKYPSIVHKAAVGSDICEDHPELARNGIRCRASGYFESDDLAVEALASGDAWSLLPELVLKRHGARLRGVPVPKDWSAPYTVGVVYRKSRENSPVVAAFSGALEAHFTGMPPRGRRERRGKSR